MANKRIDEATGTQTVGHEWDGIEELDTPMPRWWLWTFYLTIAWAVVYTILYPAWPMVNRASEGVLGWTSRGALAQELKAAEAQRAAVHRKIAASDFNAIRGDERLLAQALAGGASAFKVNCVQCHGAGAAGSQTLGYPNLNDDDWLWGGDLEAIEYTLRHGIRDSADPQTRMSAMPEFAGMFTPDQLSALADHVLSLSGKERPNARGAQIYADNCAVCHGDKGQGDRTVGAPRLNDAIWLYGGAKADIERQITRPRMGQMPHWQGRLDDATIKMLALYVHSLGGGEEATDDGASEEISGAQGGASAAEPEA